MMKLALCVVIIDTFVVPSVFKVKLCSVLLLIACLWLGSYRFALHRSGRPVVCRLVCMKMIRVMLALEVVGSTSW